MMMGSKTRLFAPIEALTLEDLVPADHFYRHLDRVLDLSFVRELVADCYATGRRPSIDPVVFFKLQLVLFFEGLRSERQLLRVVADRLSLRWYLGYDLDEPLPEHSSLTRIRDRYGLEVFRQFFDRIVEQCQQAGHVWGQEFYLDATQVGANAALDSLVPRFAVDAHLATLFAPPASDQHPPASEPARLPVAVAEEEARALEQAHAARRDWLAAVGRPDRSVQHGSYRRRSDFEASRTDRDAALMAVKGGGLALGYHDHYVVDGGQARIILNALVTPADVMENQPALDLIWHSRFRWKLRPQQVTGDTTYGTVENIVALEKQHIRAYVPLPDFEHRSPFVGKAVFVYDEAKDQYVCPHGEVLRRKTAKYTVGMVGYQAEASVCNACPLKASCTASDQGRMVHRSLFEPYHDRVRSYHATQDYGKALRKRKVWVEPLFGEAKQWHGLARCRLRGLVKVNGEALITAAGQNLKWLLARGGWGRRPWPSGAAGLRLAPETGPPLFPS